MHIPQVRHAGTGGVVVADLDERHVVAGTEIGKREPVDRQDAVLSAQIVMAAVERLGVGLADVDIAIDMVVIVADGRRHRRPD